MRGLVHHVVLTVRDPSEFFSFVRCGSDGLGLPARSKKRTG